MGNAEKGLEAVDIDALESTVFGGEKKEETPKEEEVKESSEKKIEETPKEPLTKTTLVTDEQLSINEEIVKIDVQIQQLEAESVDVSTFYDNLDTHLSDAEQALEFEDKPKYMKLVNDKLKEFEKSGSKVDEIQALKDEKENKQLIYERQSAIVEVSAKYPEYDHEKVTAYFTNDLSKAQQDKILNDSESYADVFLKTYEKYVNINPKNIKKSTTPNIPNVNDLRKETPSNTDVSTGTLSDDKLLQEALGL